MSPPEMKSTAAFWIVSGKAYLAEAVISANSLRLHMPHVRRYLVTAEEFLDLIGTFDDVIQAPVRRKDEEWYPYFIRTFAWLAGRDGELCESYLINLDVDTYVVQPFDDLLVVLSRFDLVGTTAPARYTSRTVRPVPEAFAEFNFGMLAWQNNQTMRCLFSEWADRYALHSNVYGGNDQASFRETLWQTPLNVRAWVAPPEYHFRFPFGGFARYPVRLLHGRSKTRPIGEVARLVNQRSGMRVWRAGEL